MKLYPYKYDKPTCILNLVNIISQTLLFKPVYYQDDLDSANIIIDANGALEMHIWVIHHKEKLNELQILNQQICRERGHSVYTAKDGLSRNTDANMKSSALMDILAFMLNECYENKWRDPQLNAIQKNSRIRTPEEMQTGASESGIHCYDINEIRMASCASGTSWDNLYYSG